MSAGVTRLKVLRFSSDIEILFLDFLKRVSSTSPRICVSMFLEGRLLLFPGFSTVYKRLRYT